MVKKDVLLSIVFMLISLFVINNAYDLGLMKGHVPGPGFFPFWLAVLLMIFSISLLLKIFLTKRDTTKKVSANKSFIFSIIFVIALSCVYLYFFAYMDYHFITITALYLFIFIFFLARKSSKLSLKVISYELFLSLSLTVAIYLLFSAGFSVPL